ncbi:MAG: toxin [Treponema sp.]|nr:toxin [Treponema sp.]
MIFDWSEGKNALLKESRGIGFERVVLAIASGDVLAVFDHPNKEKYKKLIMIVVRIENYAYGIPAVNDGEYWFLKTIIPSRKYTDIYLPGERRKGK